MRNAESGLLTVERTAELLGVHPDTVRRAIRTGQLRAYKLGSAPNSPLRIAVADLQRTMAGWETRGRIG